MIRKIHLAAPVIANVDTSVARESASPASVSQIPRRAPRTDKSEGRQLVGGPRDQRRRPDALSSEIDRVETGSHVGAGTAAGCGSVSDPTAVRAPGAAGAGLATLGEGVDA